MRNSIQTVRKSFFTVRLVEH